MEPSKRNTILNWVSAAILAACIGAVVGSWLSENRFSDTEKVNLLNPEKAQAVAKKVQYKKRVEYCGLRVSGSPLSGKSLYSASVMFVGWRKGRKVRIKEIFYQIPKRKDLGNKSAFEVLSPGKEIEMKALRSTNNLKWIKRAIPEEPLVLYDGTPGSVIFSFDLPLVNPKCTINFNF